jgi:ketosteroid isomerase-like protein
VSQCSTEAGQCTCGAGRVSIPFVDASNDSLIVRFYSAFAERDGAAMEACYAPEIHFSDPVFTDLHGPEAGAMWRMLTGRADDLRIELLEHEADNERGSARWRAHYTFTQTGRPVVNDVSASFRFADGKIVEHTDRFDFHRWARQALGPSGLLLGWTPVLRSAVRRRARAGLDEFMAQSAAA